MTTAESYARETLYFDHPREDGRVDRGSESLVRVRDDCPDCGSYHWTVVLHLVGDRVVDETDESDFESNR